MSGEEPGAMDLRDAADAVDGESGPEQRRASQLETQDRASATGDSWRQHPVVERLIAHRLLLFSVLVTIVALAVAYRARPAVFGDDAAITARYAERIATGKGWTYNDGDRTNGASAPLYTMVLAFLHGLGINTIDAIRYVVSACFAASIGFVAYLAGRMSGILAGVAASGLLLTWGGYRNQALFGMESALAAVLALAALVALLDEHEDLAGIFLGLALVNKLDAAFLALAIGLGVIVVGRRVPWRLAGISLAVLAPWLIFSTLYFGSPVPRSATQKLSGAVDNAAWEHHPSWMWDTFEGERTVVLVVLAAAAALTLPWLAARQRSAAMALAACLAWPLFHGLGFSFISLGDAHPWYLTVLYPPLAVSAGVAVVLIPRILCSAAPIRWSLARYAVPLAVIAGLVGFLQVHNQSPRTFLSTVRDGHRTQPYEEFEQQRRLAGMYLDDVAEPGDVISTCWGWVAYEAIDHTIDETCPLNTRDPVGVASWATPASNLGTDAPQLGLGERIVATFISSGGRVDVVAKPWAQQD